MRHINKHIFIKGFLAVVLLLSSLAVPLFEMPPMASAAPPPDGGSSSYPTCPSGQVYNITTKKCVKNDFGCGSDQVYDDVDGCVYADPSKNSAPTVLCPDGKTSVLQGKEDTCPSTGDAAVAGGNCKDVTNGCDLISNYIQPFINFLAAFVGVAVVISIVIGGIQYGSSGGDPQKVTAAKSRIRNSIIALITFVFLLSLLNFLIPGGLL